MRIEPSGARPTTSVNVPPRSIQNCQPECMTRHPLRRARGLYSQPAGPRLPRTQRRRRRSFAWLARAGKGLVHLKLMTRSGLTGEVTHAQAADRRRGRAPAAVVAVAGFLFVPSPLQKWAVERGATMATGRQVTFGDPFRLRAWPPLTITAADIRVANADWGQADELARIGALDASVDLLAYWREHRIVVDRLILTRPQLHLEVAPDGRQNWAFGEVARRRSPARKRRRPGSRGSCSAAFGSRTASRPTMTARRARAGGRRRSIWQSPRPVPMRRSRSTAG